MSYDVQALLARLANDFTINETLYSDYGACRVYEGCSTDFSEAAVWIYVPRPEIWEVKAAQTHLIEQMRTYYDLPEISSLPLAIDYYGPGKANQGIALVTRRYEDSGLDPAGESLEYPARQGAGLRFSKALVTMEQAGLSQPLVGVRTVAIRSINSVPELHLDLIFFGTITKGAPDPTLIYDPAFAAPEFSELSPEEIPAAVVSTSARAHVYAFAKYLIYAFGGPATFLPVFCQAPSEDPKAALDDGQLWANLAGSKPDPDPAPLQAMIPRGMSQELIDLLVRSVSYDPAARPQSMAMFDSGLRSTIGEPGIGGGDGTGQVTFVPPKPESNDTLKWVAAAVVMVSVLGGAAYYIVQRQAEEKRVAELLSELGEECEPFWVSINVLPEGIFRQGPLWDTINAKSQSSREAVDDHTLIEAAVEDCKTGRVDLTNLERNVIEEHRARLEAALTFARGTGATEAGVDALAAEAVLRADVEDGSAQELVTRIDAAHDRLIREHGKVLGDRAAALIGDVDQLRGLWSLPEGADTTPGFVEALRSARAEDPAPDTLLLVHEQTGALRDEARTLLAGDVSGRVAALRARLTPLRELIEDGAIVQALARDLDEASAPLLLDVAVIGARYTDLVGLSERIGALEQQGQDNQDLLADLIARVSELRSQASAAGWDEDAALNEMFREASVLPERAGMALAWETLVARLMARSETLDAEWRNGRALCTRFREDFAAQARDLDGLPVYAELEVSDAKALAAQGNGPVGRALFASCAEGDALMARATTELTARKLLADLDVARTRALEQGASPAVPTFATAERRFETLSSSTLPSDLAALPQFERDVLDTISGYEVAAGEIAGALADFDRLSAAKSDAEDQARSTGLALHPAWSELVLAQQPVSRNDVLDAIPVLQQHVTDMSALQTLYDAGELLNCASMVHAMTVISVAPDAVIDLATAVFGPNAQSYLSGPGQALAGQHCLGRVPVSMSDLLAWDRALPGNSDFKLEIAAARAGAQGEALNVSHFLARGYAQWLGRQENRVFCVAPAILSRAAAESGARAAAGTGTEFVGAEISGTACSGGFLPEVIEQYTDGSPQAGPHCIAVNERRPAASFRIAAGDICTQEASR